MSGMTILHLPARYVPAIRRRLLPTRLQPLSNVSATIGLRC